MVSDVNLHHYNTEEDGGGEVERAAKLGQPATRRALESSTVWLVAALARLVLSAEEEEQEEEEEEKEVGIRNRLL